MADTMSRSSLEDVPDPILAQRAGEGDVRAFEVLVRRHAPVVRVYARRILGSSTDVDDVAQDTFVAAWQQLPTLQDSRTVRGWLLTITTRKAIDRIRVRRNTDDIDDHDQLATEADGPEQRAQVRGRHRALSAALQQLPEDQRRCWVLKELGEYSYDEIAAELILPVSTVRGLLSRARKNIVREMEAWR